MEQATRLAGQAKHAFQQSFAAQPEQLLGTAQAAAGSGGEKEGGHCHRHQSNR